MIGNILRMEPRDKTVFDLFDLDPQSAQPLEPAVRAFRLALLLGQRLRHLMDERLRVDGLTTQQAALITAVTTLGDPSLTKAASCLGTTHQNAAQLVSALERKGFLRVEPDPADRRRKRLIATETNDEYWRGRDPGDHAAVAKWFSALDPDELDTFVRLTVRVLDTITANDVE
jgi:DNA-binding MarR family transcriptional regulator